MTVDDELQRLRDRIIELEELLGISYPIPPTLGLTSRECAYLGMLIKRPIVTRDAAMIAIYSGGFDDPCEKIVDAHILKLRRKLARHSIAIATRWGQGWYLDPANRRKVKELIERHKQQAAA